MFGAEKFIKICLQNFLRLLWTTSRSSLYLDQALTCRRQYLSQVFRDLHLQKFGPLSIRPLPTGQRSRSMPWSIASVLEDDRWSSLAELLRSQRETTKVNVWGDLDDMLLYVVKIGFLLGMIMGLPIPGWMDVWTHLCCAWGCVYDLRPVCQRDQGLHRPAGEKEEGRATNLKSIFSQVAESTLDAIVDTLANGEFCANVGEGCPEVVDFVIRWKFWKIIFFSIAQPNWLTNHRNFPQSELHRPLRQGLPLLASADVGGDATFQEVNLLSNSTPSLLILIAQFSFFAPLRTYFQACNGSVPGTCPA